MRALIVLLLLSITPIVYANEQVVNTIKNINIQGINIDTNYEQAHSIFIKNGYTETYYDQYAFKATKGSCKININPRDAHYEHTPKGPGNLIGMINYTCQKNPRAADKNLSPAVRADVEKSLTDLCKTKDNGKKSRQGCNPRYTGFIKETFVHQTTYKDGYNYSAQFQLIKSMSISLQLYAKESKIPPKNMTKINQKTVEETAKFPSSVVGASNENIIEANKAYEECESDPRISNWYNCECFAGSILKDRMASGFAESSQMIRLRAFRSPQCAQLKRQAPHNECMTRWGRYRYGSSGSRMSGTVEEFCGCYTDKLENLVDNIKNSTIEKYDRAQKSLKDTARSTCIDQYRKKI
jgi:hypothetical protein